MNLYGFLVSAYDSFLAFFPPELQWVVTLFIIIGLIGTFVSLVQHNALYLLLLVIVLPIVAPVIGHLVSDLWHFVLYLLHVVGVTAPKG